MTASKRRSSWWADTLLIVLSIVLSFAAAEAVVRLLNGQPLLAFPLPDAVETARVKPGQLEQIKLADGVDRSWFERDPPPLPNRGRPPADWQKVFNDMQQRPINNDFQPFDAFKAWNSASPDAHRAKTTPLQSAPPERGGRTPASRARAGITANARRPT